MNVVSLILNYPSDQQSQDCLSHIDKPYTNTLQLCYHLCTITVVVITRNIEGNNSIVPY